MILDNNITYFKNIMFYSASGKYSLRFMFSKFCYVIKKFIKLIFFLKIRQTIPHDDNKWGSCGLMDRESDL